jgi:hypothetical protein
MSSGVTKSPVRLAGAPHWRRQMNFGLTPSGKSGVEASSCAINANAAALAQRVEAFDLRSNQSGFESPEPHQIRPRRPIWQESSRLEREQCQFESDRGYHSWWLTGQAHRPRLEIEWSLRGLTMRDRSRPPVFMTKMSRQWCSRTMTALIATAWVKAAVTVYTPITIARFWSKVRVGRRSECWPFTGSTNKFGHGKLKLEKTRLDKPAHIIAYELFNGDVPDGLQVQHTCDNARCCNPFHLYAGTQKQNVADMHSRGRWKLKASTSRKGENNPRAHLTNNQVIEIKRRIAGGETNVGIAKDFQVSHGTISLIRLGKTWWHITLS